MDWEMRCLNRAEIKVNTLFCHLQPGIDSWATLLPISLEPFFRETNPFFVSI
jgi:hypothetical protein